MGSLTLTPYAYYNFPILSDRGIRRILGDGNLKISPALDSGQLQPASLDMRIGRVRVYDSKSMAQTMGATNGLSEPTSEFAKVFDLQKDEPLEIPSNSFVEIFFNQDVIFDRNDYWLSIDSRSSLGRCNLSLTNEMLVSEEKRFYASFFNVGRKPVRIYGGDKFVQLFFHPRKEGVSSDGNFVSDPDEARKIASDVCKGEVDMVEHYLVLRAGDYALRFREDLEVIDTRNVNGSCYKKFSLEGEGLNLGISDPAIFQLQPRFELPSDVGFKVFREVPMAHRSFATKPDYDWMDLELRTARATWVDPGYNGNITCHPLRTKSSGMIKKGMPIALGMFVKFFNPVERPYGSSGLGSHYQGSKGVGASS